MQLFVDTAGKFRGERGACGRQTGAACENVFLRGTELLLNEGGVRGRS